MKKKITALFLVLCVAAGMTACGKKADSEPPKEAPAESADTASTESAADSGKTAEEEQQETDTSLRIDVTLKRMETEETFLPDPEVTDIKEPIPDGYVTYPAFAMPDASRTAYPKLANTLDAITREYYNRALSTLAEESNMATEWKSYEDAPTMFTSNEQNWEPTIMRADERIVSVLMTEESYYNGAHPFTDYACFAIDTASGERLPLSDVINDMFELPDILLANLEPIADDYTFTEEENAEMLPKIQDMVADGGLVWTLDDEGFHAYFDAYDLQFYAFGPIFVNLSYKDWPSLIKKEYMPSEGAGKVAPLRERVNYTDERDSKEKIEKWKADEIKRFYVPYEWEEGDSSAEPEAHVITCPDWSAPYVAAGIVDTATEPLITFHEVDKESSDWIDASAWSAKTGIPLPASTYGFSSGTVNGPIGTRSDDNYTYTVYNYPEDKVLKVSVKDIYSTPIGTYDFSAFLNTPKPGNEFTEMEIPYVTLKDGTLYVEIAHRTYSADQPCTAYIVAVRMEDGTLLWRSEPLVANGHNFVINGDMIICGYGFTKEDDYLCLLSACTGNVLMKKELKSAPDYFIPRNSDTEDLLYVITYNTVYTYRLSYG